MFGLMRPLDLSAAPPRSAWQRLDGLVLMPRSIDKLRAKLPGGNPGEYLTHRGVTPVLFKVIRVHEDALFEIVGTARDDDDVAAWLREHADTSRYERANQLFSQLTVSSVPADLHEIFESFYAGRDPGMERVLDVLDWDDARTFGPPPPGQQTSL